MSRRANTTLIGAFVLGALISGTLLVVYLGAINIFARKEVFVAYFDESVNGLSEGAPVKFKGVPIGRVRDIRIRFNQPRESDAVPVFLEIDAGRLQSDLGVASETDLSNPRVYLQQINAGLRAQLVTDSIITGLLFIELDYYPQAGLPNLVQEEPVAYLEIPTVPSPLAELGQNATDILAKLAAFDVERISDELVAALTLANDRLGKLDVEGLNAAVADSAAAIEALTTNPEINATLEAVQTTLVAVQQLVARLDEDYDPLMTEVQGSLADLRETLVALRGTARELERTVQPESPLRYELENALRDMAAAAESVRRLVDDLERNPRSILTGRPLPKE